MVQLSQRKCLHWTLIKKGQEGPGDGEEIGEILYISHARVFIMKSYLLNSSLLQVNICRPINRNEILNFIKIIKTERKWMVARRGSTNPSGKCKSYSINNAITVTNLKCNNSGRFREGTVGLGLTTLWVNILKKLRHHLCILILHLCYLEIFWCIETNKENKLFTEL